MDAILGDGAEEKLWPAKGRMSTGGEEERWNVGTLECLYDGTLKAGGIWLTIPPTPHAFYKNVIR